MRRLLIVTVAASVGVALLRLGWWSYFISFRPPFPIYGAPVTCIFLPMVCAGGVALLALTIWLFRRTASPLPLVVLTTGIFLAFNIPLPSPESLYFAAHKADYEAVLEFISQNRLDPAFSNCTSEDRTTNKFRDVSSAYCIVAGTDTMRGFHVIFFPLERDRFLIYVEKISDYPCATGEEEEKIDDHWHVCYEGYLLL